MRRLFVRSFAIAFVAFAVLFGLEFFVEWRRAGYPGFGAQSWAGVNNAKLVDVLSPIHDLHDWRVPEEKIKYRTR